MRIASDSHSLWDSAWRNATCKAFMLFRSDFYNLCMRGTADLLLNGPVINTQCVVDDIRFAQLFHACMQDDVWRQLAMGHSLEDGTLVFFHRGTKGAKTGSDGELNPMRRYWPSHLSSPITGIMAPKIFGWDDGKQMLTFNKEVVEASDFHCSSHSSHRLGNLQAFAICPWDGTHKLAKAKFAPSGGMQAVANVLHAFEALYDSVLEATAEATGSVAG